MTRCRFESHCWRDRIGQKAGRKQAESRQKAGRNRGTVKKCRGPKGGRKGATYKKWVAHDGGKNMMVSQISYASRPGTSTTSKTNNHGLHTPTISTECPEIDWAAY
jgi:hypothetical protein